MVKRAGPGAALKEMSGEHYLQIAIMTAIEGCLSDGSEKSLVLELLDQLIGLSEVHFLSEQLLMRIHAYPALAAHQQEHQRLTAEVRRIEQAFASAGSEDLGQSVKSLKHWVIGHIQTMDHAFGQFLSTKMDLSSALIAADAS
jgi:methyl-accepting chemotaxis protein